MEKDYGYVDKGEKGTVHVVDTESIAKANAAGIVVETDIKGVHGYPQIPGPEGKPVDVVAYVNEQEIYVGGNRNDGVLTPLASLPADLQELLIELGLK